jgi:hypothetical protein
MLFKGTVFSTGGYSALYGQALSSALILESIDLPENRLPALVYHRSSLMEVSSNWQKIGNHPGV